MNNAKILSVARDRMAEAIKADEQNREDALNDLEFLSGKQWPEKERSEREAANRPTPTINRLTRFVRQVTGDIRKLNPAIRVLSADRAATPEVSEIFEGLIRHIQADCDASSVYEGAAESAAQCGIGGFRILAEYEDETGFDQVLKIKRIHNPMSIYWDPAAREATRSDAEFCFITDQMKAEDFKKMYPKAGENDAEHDGQTDGMEYWHQEGRVVVAEYFWKERESVEIGLMRDGTVIEKPNAAMDLVKTRKADRVRVKWAKISGQNVLEGPKNFPSSYIPVISVVGEEMHIGERVVRTSVIRNAKDSQQIYNYYAATQTEVVALQPKAPYLVTPKQVAGLEGFWNSANVANRPYLPFNPDEKVGMPQRAQPAVSSQGIEREMLRAEDDMKATTGIYDAALGGRSNEQSGVAIRQRQLESDISTSIYTDNLSKSIEQCGRVIVDMIPRIYDTQRVLRILGEDDKEKMVPVNGAIIEGGEVRPVNPLTQGKYDVRVTVGPNYTTRRQETSESMMQFVQAFPAAGEVAGDLIA
ncbi:MAG: portal protein, partial [Pikeienuella sp.]